MELKEQVKTELARHSLLEPGASSHLKEHRAGAGAPLEAGGNATDVAILRPTSPRFERESLPSVERCTQQAEADRLRMQYQAGD